jgi:FMN phosphatase YigB (HAD superfamily)
MFRQALAHFRCEPQGCLFIGDNPRWDTLGAQRAGMISVLIDRTGQANTNADFQIQSLLQLTGILEHIEYRP